VIPAQTTSRSSGRRRPSASEHRGLGRECLERRERKPQQLTVRPRAECPRPRPFVEERHLADERRRLDDVHGAVVNAKLERPCDEDQKHAVDLSLTRDLVARPEPPPLAVRHDAVPVVGVAVGEKDGLRRVLRLEGVLGRRVHEPPVVECPPGHRSVVAERARARNLVYTKRGR
jgi:hypothetical protein